MASRKKPYTDAFEVLEGAARSDPDTMGQELARRVSFFRWPLTGCAQKMLA